jgi:nitrogen fixation protein NifB
LGEGLPPELMEALKSCEAMPKKQALKVVKPQDASRPYVAVASMEGVLVNQHLGEAYQLFVYGKNNGTISLIEKRYTPEPGAGLKRWEELADVIGDCSTLLVSGIGPNPKQVLTRKGIEVVEIEGLIDEAVRTVYDGASLKHLAKRKMTACGSGCGGTGVGCG